MFPSVPSRVSRRSLVLLAAFSAVLPALPTRPAAAGPEPEPTRTSRLVHVILPDGARRLPDAGPVAELTAQLQTVAREGKFTLGASLWSLEKDPNSRVPCLMMGSARDNMVRYRRAAAPGPAPSPRGRSLRHRAAPLRVHEKFPPSRLKNQGIAS